MNFANLSFFQPIPAIIAIITKEKKTAKKRSIESKWSRGLGHEIRKDSKSSGSQDIDCQSASCVQRMSKMLEGSRLQIKVLEVQVKPCISETFSPLLGPILEFPRDGDA